MNCPRDVEPVRLTGVRASAIRAGQPDHVPSRCVDGSRITWCFAVSTGTGKAPWLSVRVEAGVQVDSVRLYVFYPWDLAEYRLAPYEVWAGRATYGDRDVRCQLLNETAGGIHAGIDTSIDVESLPTASGMPAVLSCAGVHSDEYPYITVVTVGTRDDMKLSELVVYKASAEPRGTLLPTVPLVHGDVAAQLSARFEAGLPSDNISSAVHARRARRCPKQLHDTSRLVLPTWSRCPYLQQLVLHTFLHVRSLAMCVWQGVLIHMLDGFEQADSPWEVCAASKRTKKPMCTPLCRCTHVCPSLTLHVPRLTPSCIYAGVCAICVCVRFLRQACTTVCQQRTSDHWSASLINSRAPGLFSGQGGGFTIHPSVRLLCAYPRDFGIGSYANAHCDGPAGAGWDPAQYAGHTLADAMNAQLDLGAGYNDVAVSFEWWEDNVPWAVESFLVLGTDNERLERMRRVHRHFLRRYGLSAAEVPLLRYESACQQTTCWQPWNMRCDRPSPNFQCFVDVS